MEGGGEEGDGQGGGGGRTREVGRGKKRDEALPFVSIHPSHLCVYLREAAEASGPSVPVSVTT